MRTRSVNNNFSPVIFLFLFSGCALNINAQHQGSIVMDIKGYPLVFELNAGEKHTIKRSFGDKTIERTIQVISIKHFTEPNLWFSGSLPSQNYAEAEIIVDVSGERATLLHRPYESPATVNGLRIYVEATREWAQNAELADMKDIKKEVRLSVCLEGEPWGPESLMFPIRDYRWRSAAYNNTWSSLVPYNRLYYHRGEDYGAIPDMLEVVSPADGKIIKSPLPAGDGRSNEVSVENSDGIVFRISHMNIETITRQNKVGSNVQAGTVLGKTGMTWDGRKSQVNDPHCHIDISYEDTKLASFPYLIEAYQRMYGDPVLAVAGGYQFTTAMEEVRLDATRSIPSRGEKIKRYSWKLHDGKTFDAPVITTAYDTPGLYTEELIVVTENGHEDRDFLQVRVYDKQQSMAELVYGWAYYYPVRNITTSTDVVFWNRLASTKSAVTIDFGDGSPVQPIVRELRHIFREKGNYTVTLSSVDRGENPVILKLEVKVE